MCRTIISLLIGLCLVSVIYSQEGDFVESDNLPDGWELYQVEFLEGLLASLPVLESRTNFLEQKLYMDGEGKFILRISYNHKTQLYVFLVSACGTFEGISHKTDAELETILWEAGDEIVATINADAESELSGNRRYFSNITGDMIEIAMLPRYCNFGDELILLRCDGYQSPESDESEIDEITENTNVMMQFLSFDLK